MRKVGAKPGGAAAAATRNWECSHGGTDRIGNSEPKEDGEKEREGEGGDEQSFEFFNENDNRSRRSG